MEHSSSAWHKWRNSTVQFNNVSIIFLPLDTKSQEMQVKEEEAILRETQKIEEVSTAKRNRKIA